MLCKVEEDWKKRKMELQIGPDLMGPIKHAASCELTKRILTPSKETLEQMMKELVDEASKWDLEPKPTSLRWTGTHADEVLEDIVVETKDRAMYVAVCG